MKKKLNLGCGRDIWKGYVNVDVKKLEKMLGVPVVPTVAITAEGVKGIVERLKEAKAQRKKLTDKQRWAKIGRIVEKVQRIRPKEHTIFEGLEHISMKPATGMEKSPDVGSIPACKPIASLR